VTATRIIALLAAFIAIPAAAQPSSYSVINNTAQALTCSVGSPNGSWGPWFRILPGANWVAPGGGPPPLFQCRPPVVQISYPLRPGVTYRLLAFGAEARLVQVQGQ
jgi:hypothetical protein